MANRHDLSPPQLSCGFEYVPYTRLVRGNNPGVGHWATTRLLPPGYTEEQEYGLYREEEPGTHLLFECLVGNDSFVSTASNCEGQQAMGPLGWAHSDPVPGTVALYRCNSEAGDHMISPDPNCEGYTTESLLGYVFTWPPPLLN